MPRAERDPEDRPEVHLPVMADEVLDRLRPAPGEIHVDATVGAGGHAVRILEKLSPGGLLLGIDRDPEILDLASERLAVVGGQFRLVRGVFSRINEHLEKAGLRPEGAMDGLLLDLGVSSLQLDRPERGFSFLRDGPLDMRMSQGEGESALELVQKATPEELETVLREYGEEPAARRIVRAITEARAQGALRTTGQLAALVERVLPRQGKRSHPATRTFQGIRIAVNRELEHLRLILRDLDRWIKPGGRVVVLSYHSLEDRIVKETFRERAKEGLYHEVKPNPLAPSEDEIKRNPRARSARLRSVVRAGGESP